MYPQKILLIAGGYDKHIPYDAIGPAILEKAKALILLGDTAEAIQAAVENAPGYRPGILPHCTGILHGRSRGSRPFPGQRRGYCVAVAGKRQL